VEVVDAGEGVDQRLRRATGRGGQRQGQGVDGEVAGSEVRFDVVAESGYIDVADGGAFGQDDAHDAAVLVEREGAAARGFGGKLRQQGRVAGEGDVDVADGAVEQEIAEEAAGQIAIGVLPKPDASQLGESPARPALFVGDGGFFAGFDAP
jgi:hypothetical protein